MAKPNDSNEREHFMEEYVNAQGVHIHAEQVSEGEHAGLWHVVDMDGSEGHVTDEQFKDNWKPVNEAPTSAPAAASEE